MDNWKKWHSGSAKKTGVLEYWTCPKAGHLKKFYSNCRFVMKIVTKGKIEDKFKNYVIDYLNEWVCMTDSIKISSIESADGMRVR